MRSAIIGFVIGAAWLQAQAALPSTVSLCLLAASAVALLVLAARLAPAPGGMARTTTASLLRALAGAAAGFFWAALLAHFYLSRELPVELEGRDIAVVGVVKSMPQQMERGTRFHFEIEATPLEPELAARMPPKISLAWYGGYGDRREADAPALLPGERWQLNVRLRRPHGNANPHGFDYEAWLLEQNIRATGYVREGNGGALRETANRRLDAFVFGARQSIELLRYRLRDKLAAALEDRRHAGVLIALAIGDQQAIPQSDWKLFNRAGIGHLVSISGLHITMIAGLFAAIAAMLWKRSFFTGAALPLRLPAQKAGAFAGAVAALLYVALAGFGVPAQRTLIMLAVVAFALWRGSAVSVSRVLCIALGAVVLFDPWAVLWPGFWLSFGAVALILFLSEGRGAASNVSPDATVAADGPRATLRQATRLQLGITLGLAPLTMLLFGQISLIGPIANAIAIPLISFVVTPLALAGAALPQPLAGPLLNLGHTLLEWLSALLAWMAQWPAAVWSAPLPTPWMFALALAGTVWLLAPRGWPLRWLGIAGWIPLLLNAPTHPPPGEVWVTAFDVGQGGAVLVETANRRLLYDTGPFYSVESDGGSRVIVPYLKARGIARLDAVVVSHQDNDHSGGALSVFDEISVDWVSSSLEPDAPIARAAPNHRNCRAGDAWSWDGVRFDMLHPYYPAPGAKPNTLSCTLKISTGAHALLLPGDIEAAQEAQLLAHSTLALKASVLLAPHHGSGTSSTAAFLRAVQPDIAIFQVGYRNRYRHPKREVYERYGELGIARLRTDESGAVLLRMGEKLEAVEYRRERPRYWHGR